MTKFVLSLLTTAYAFTRIRVPLAFGIPRLSTDNTMIRKNSLFCKLIRIKSSSKDLFDAFMASYLPAAEACPSCSSSGNCHIHAYYARRITDFIHGKVRQELVILRVICSSCGHTHAVLPDFIIPYSGYGLFFILRVLAEHFLGLHTVEHICGRFSITHNQFYKWLALWNAHKEEWLGVLASLETRNRDFLRSLVSMPSYSDFTSGFLSLSARSFLQSHKNPAGCRLLPSATPDDGG